MRFYPDFYGKYGYPIGMSSSLPHFILKLESKKQSDAYLKQAEHAINIMPPMEINKKAAPVPPERLSDYRATC